MWNITLSVSDAAFCICGFRMILIVNRDYFLSDNKLIVVMVKCGVLFEVRTEFLNDI
jgi:hypothetical protein